MLDAIKKKSNPFGASKVQRKLMEILLSSHGCGVWVWDLTSNRVDWSPEIYKIFKKDDFDNTIESYQKLVHRRDLQPLDEEISRAIVNRAVLHTKFRAVLPNGHIKLVGCMGRACYDANGMAETFVGTIFDLNEFDGTAPKSEPGQVADGTRQLFADYVDADRMRDLRDEIRFHLRHVNHASQRIMERNILEFLLVRIVSPEVAAEQAQALMNRFKTLADVVNTPLDALRTIEGVGEAHRLIFDIVSLSMQIILQPVQPPAMFKNAQSILTYLRAAQAYQTKEQLRVVFLDKRRHIISNELMQEGTIDHTPVYIREIMKRALELSASAMVLVHNHPSGDPKPSHGDIDMTLKISRVARELGIAVVDHIVLGREGHVSMKAMKLF